MNHLSPPGTETGGCKGRHKVNKGYILSYSKCVSSLNKRTKEKKNWRKKKNTWGLKSVEGLFFEEAKTKEKRERPIFLFFYIKTFSSPPASMLIWGASLVKKDSKFCFIYSFRLFCFNSKHLFLYINRFTSVLVKKGFIIYGSISINTNSSPSRNSDSKCRMVDSEFWTSPPPTLLNENEKKKFV